MAPAFLPVRSRSSDRGPASCRPPEASLPGTWGVGFNTGTWGHESLRGTHSQRALCWAPVHALSLGARRPRLPPGGAPSVPVCRAHMAPGPPEGPALCHPHCCPVHAPAGPTAACSSGPRPTPPPAAKMPPPLPVGHVRKGTQGRREASLPTGTLTPGLAGGGGQDPDGPDPAGVVSGLRLRPWTRPADCKCRRTGLRATGRRGALRARRVGPGGRMFAPRFNLSARRTRASERRPGQRANECVPGKRGRRFAGSRQIEHKLALRCGRREGTRGNDCIGMWRVAPARAAGRGPGSLPAWELRTSPRPEVGAGLMSRPWRERGTVWEQGW